MLQTLEHETFTAKTATKRCTPAARKPESPRAWTNMDVSVKGNSCILFGPSREGDPWHGRGLRVILW